MIGALEAAAMPKSAAEEQQSPQLTHEMAVF